MPGPWSIAPSPGVPAGGYQRGGAGSPSDVAQAPRGALSMSRWATATSRSGCSRSAPRGARRSRPSGGARRCSRSRSPGAPCPRRRTAAAGSRAAGPGARRAAADGRRGRCSRRPARPARSARAGRARSAGWAGSARRAARSSSRGGPCLKPKLVKVTASLPTVLRGRNSSAIFSRSIAADMPVVSITRSARPRSGSSSSRSAATPAADAALGRERVAAAGLLVAGHQRLLGGLEEQHAVVQAQRVQVVDDRPQRLEVDAAAHVGDDRRALDLGALVHEQLDQRADHLRRQVVDAEVARVLEHVHRRRLAGAGEAGDHHQVLEARLEDRLAQTLPPAARSGRRGLMTAIAVSIVPRRTDTR